MDTTQTPTPTEAAPQKAVSRPRWGMTLAWIGVLALLAIVAFSLFQSDQGPVAIGQEVPPFTLTTFEGQVINSADLRGKVVVINFWASWCKPCEQEAADMETAWRYYEPGGEVLFLGVNWTDTEGPAKEYLNKFSITYPNGPDLGTRIADRYRITGVPETYIVDQNGILVYTKFSPFVSVDEIKQAIDPLLTK